MSKFSSGTIHCQNCSFSQLCLPFSLSENEMAKLDDIIQRKRPFQKNDTLFQSGDPLTNLYAVRTGTFKTYTVTPDGEEQIIGFHLPGDVVGFDAIQNSAHRSTAMALETAMVCEIPYSTLENLSGDLPRLRQQVMRMMSQEIFADQEMFLLLNKRTATQRLAFFLSQLGRRYGERGFSAKEFRLTMTRAEIGNFLGLTVETISRLLTRFQQEGLIQVDGKLITLLDPRRLEQSVENVAALKNPNTQAS
ncbi:Regulatory protein HlyX [Saliniradius amylolyticus]|uniref:Regulatory protein HlyX n=1 Tax=Saliniradius amylolyticus TaxID=2183582 RepID=A0A2S2E2T6_9ALTE|nr:fumarate/nitrate reduction transcriptional regulator Fnr [Saliniradius amylolyticus]AWL11958.1 Regulatory protein HlyX [Saliniradius amylolyticus]